MQAYPEAPSAIRECASEAAVLLDAIIHDLRTPLSAMSGWLEVLEAHFGEADGIVGRALLGLRRGVDSQTLSLSGLSDVLMKQRIELPAQGDCLVLERMQLALEQLESQPDSALVPAQSARLKPVKAAAAGGSLTCRDAGSSLNDACETLMHALALSQDEPDAPVGITANADKVTITVPGGSGDPSALRSLCQGLAVYSAKRPEIRAQALWLARLMLQRCELALQMSPAAGGGFHLVLTKAIQA
jgi:signal transduction histidine kinase